MAKPKKQQSPTLPRGLDEGRLAVAMEAAGQIQVLTKQLLNYIDKAREMDRWECETIIRALASRCSSLASSAYTLLNADDNCVGREDIEKIERMVGHG
jgi:hypothetical protein